jgi:signal recognition particle receptor subunit beta
MATINFATREITSKIVYFGARGAGCNTNVSRLHALVSARRRGELHRVPGPDPEAEHAWSFHYLAQGPDPIEGFGLGWELWSLPGGIELAQRREDILRGADAVVFVADARPDRNEANVTSLLELEQMLGRLGQPLATATVVLQVNHTDAEGSRPLEDVTFDLNPYGFPVAVAVARDGSGLLETHDLMTRAVAERIADTLAGNPSPVLLSAFHDPDEDADHVQRFLRDTQAPALRAEESLPEQPEDPGLSTEELMALPEGPTVEVAFQPRDFLGSHPVRVLSAAVDHDRVWVDLVMERMSGGEARRLTVVLANRPTDTPPIQRAAPASPVPRPAGDSVFDYLPETGQMSRTQDSPPAPRDLPPVWYGVLGVGGGLLIGALSAVLVGGLFG